MSEELSDNNEKCKNFEGLELAQKIAYTLPETKTSFRFQAFLQVSKPSLAIVGGQVAAITA